MDFAYVISLSFSKNLDPPNPKEKLQAETISKLYMFKSGLSPLEKPHVKRTGW